MNVRFPETNRSDSSYTRHGRVRRASLLDVADDADDLLVNRGLSSSGTQHGGHSDSVSPHSSLAA